MCCSGGRCSAFLPLPPPLPSPLRSFIYCSVCAGPWATRCICLISFALLTSRRDSGFLPRLFVCLVLVLVLGFFLQSIPAVTAKILEPKNMASKAVEP